MPTLEREHGTLSRILGLVAFTLGWLGASPPGWAAPAAQQGEANVGSEITFQAARPHADPFQAVTLDVVFTDPVGAVKTVPAFWAGGDTWKVRYASPLPGTHRYRSVCSAMDDSGLHGVEGRIEIKPYTGKNPLYRHGPIRVAADCRHFEHADGTPFFWLGDTWWKCLCKRLTWEGFQELTADRQAKGFTVVQIVCGSYPDEGLFEARWENEGGKPYETRDFSVVNPKYFEYADRRIEHLVDSGIVPAIVGGWGRPDCNGMLVGVDGIKRHWRNLVARYGAYPVVWIVGGEIPEETRWGQGPWGEVAQYLRSIDPYHHPITSHCGGARHEGMVTDFDMVGGNHDATAATTAATLAILTTAYSNTPPRPVLCGETSYEGHMQQAWQDVQRHEFWMYMLNGAAGHTYGAAGVWHASVDGDPGIANVYDFTTWKEGMNYPGSTQIGLGKKLLEQYPWWRFKPHPEWAESDCYAAGIPGEVRFIYQPRRGIYNWNGTVVKKLERDAPYRAFYFNPVNGKRYAAGPPPKPFEGHTLPLLFTDTFDGADASAWKDYGTPSQRKDGRLTGGKGLVTVLEKFSDADLMASTDASSDAEAGIILRFHDADNYLVALYSPSLKSIFLHDRTRGQWGAALGKVDVPEIGPKIHLIAAACGEYAALVLTDGTKTCHTPTVKVGNVTGGKTGLWLYQIGERQEFDTFELSRASFVPVNNTGPVLGGDQYKAPPLPSPQDWVLVLERVLDQ